MKIVAQYAIVCPVTKSVIYINDCSKHRCQFFRQINTNLDGTVAVICGCEDKGE
jgi:hypothetical protein